MIGGRIIVVLSLVLSPVLTIPSPNQPGANSTGFIQPKILVGDNGCLTSGRHTLAVGQTVCVASPGYPDKYDNNANAWWRIESADQETGYLDVSCPMVNIRGSPNCRADYLTIAYSNSEQDYCGNIRPPAHFLADKRVGFEFRSDGSRRAQGFLCHVTAKRYIPDPPSCNCGQANTNRIVDGVPSGVNEYPWLVALVYEGYTFPICGGSLYNTEWVITAAHCVENVDKKLEILLGMHNWATQNPTPTRRSVSQIISHGLYGVRAPLDSDIAMVKLSSPVSPSNSIQPVCLAQGTVVFPGTNSYATGWGRLSSEGPKPHIPDKVELPIRSHQECEAAHGSNYVTDNMICAGTNSISEGVCQGDSGGPMTVEVLGRHYLVGVTSFTPHKCGVYPFLSGFTYVPNYITFITNIAGAQCA